MNWGDRASAATGRQRKVGERAWAVVMVSNRVSESRSCTVAGRPGVDIESANDQKRSNEKRWRAFYRETLLTFSNNLQSHGYYTATP